MSKHSNDIALYSKIHTFTQFRDKFMVCNKFGAIYGRNLRIHIRFDHARPYYCPTVFHSKDEADRFISTVENGHITIDDIYSEEELGQYV